MSTAFLRQAEVPPPPPYDGLPPALVATLVRSFDARRRGRDPDAQRSLAAYWPKAPDSPSVWALLDETIDWQDLNTLVRVHQRLEAVDPTGALWRDHVRYVVRAYTSGIYALELVYEDRAALARHLDALTGRRDAPLLARERPLLQRMHAGTRGWREVSRADQLHICVADGSRDDAWEDCHIDEVSFTAGRNADGTTRHAWWRAPWHFLQSQLRWIDIARPFARLEPLVRAPAGARPPLRPETATALADWAAVRDAEAISGEAGHRRATALLRRILADGAALRLARP